MPVTPRSILCIILLITALLPCSGRAIDRTIAKINDTILTESDLANVIAELAGLHHSTGINAFAEATSETVASMLDRALLLQEAKRRQIVPSNQELHRQVENMVQEIRDNFPTETEFYQALASERLSLDQLKEQLLKQTRDDFMVYHVVDSRFSLSDEELKQASGDTAQASPASFRLRRLGIQVTKKQDAQAASQKARATVAQTITDGITFEEGVRRYSQVPGAAQDGGDMGYVSADKLSPDVRAAVEDLNVGQASAPVIAGGYANIFYVEGKRSGRIAIREKKFIETRNELLASLRRRAILQVYDQRLLPLLTPDYKARLTGNPISQASSQAPAASTPTPQQQQIHPSQPTPAQFTPTPYQQTYPHATPAPARQPTRWPGWRRRQ